MAEHHTPPETVIWTAQERLGLVADLLSLLDGEIRPIAIAGPRPTQPTDLAAEYDCPCLDDLRKLLVEYPARYVLLATGQEVNPADLSNAVSHGSTILTLDPVTCDLNWMDAGVHLLPTFLESPGWRHAADPTSAMENVHAIHYATTARQGEQSLFASLFDAWNTILSLAQIPQSIDASLVGPLAQPPDDLHHITGHLSAHARITEDAAATIQLSDRAGQLNTRIQLIADSVHLVADNQSYSLFDTEGKTLDSYTADTPALNYVQLVAAHWQHLIDSDRPVTTADQQAALACCQATLLSARTGDPESPAKLLQLQGR